MNELRVLVVDDEVQVVSLWADILSADGLAVTGMSDPRAALAVALASPFDLILCDIEMPGLRGLDFLKAVLQERPGQMVIMLTAFGTIELAMEAVRAGAADFLSKPVRPEALRHAVRRVLGHRRLQREVARLRRQTVAQDGVSRTLIARSAPMRRVLDLALRVGRTSAPVLLEGPSGTGKTALAEFIHAEGSRSGGPFIAVNAATVPAALADAELFGVRRGAFTDAREDREGVIAAASGGTLFLDEVVELPLEVQAKLLKVLETGRYRRVGDTVERQCDIRVVCASNVSLAAAVERGVFRADLRFRLEVLAIRLPPLAERSEDIRPLAQHWLDVLAVRHGRELARFTPDAWRWLEAWSWPGNVRELINRIERALVFCESDQIDEVALSDGAPAVVSATGPFAQLWERGLRLDQVEALYTAFVLDRCGGNKSEAARSLGVDRKTLQRRLDALVEPVVAAATCEDPAGPV